MNGVGGKFDIVCLMLKIGAGIGLMSFSALISDCIVLKFAKKRKFYNRFIVLDFVKKQKTFSTQL
jgi:hypothetical protein